MERWPRRSLLWLLAGACGLAALGYCVYFDQKRRSAPDFKRRLREKRRKECEKTKEHDAELRELKDTAKLQEFFLEEIQLGQLWLARGEHKKSIEHLANAISVCTHPNQLMHVLKQTLPPHIFEMLLHSIPYAMQRLETALNEQDTTTE
ncbi:TOMM20-like protein 1 isoform X2 [Rhineura floridana]|uniref:TOMM20-like protein 1 isoform X2 n=1 Tax=Rhineura floridana TaxID=261503 RepID=UPI002AC87051|nr:TOMM20-like protein 1 isoform X2 [Rhineura floridana]